jgi:hypothetical protein
MAARMTDACVTATIFPGVASCASSHAATRSISASYGFPSMRSCARIAQPYGHGFRFLGLNLVERAACPSPVVAIP